MMMISHNSSTMTISHHDKLEEPAACEVTAEPDLPTFKEKRAVTIQNSTKFKWFFDQFGLSELTRLLAARAILQIAEQNGKECMGLSGPVCKILKDTSLSITFTEMDK
ncbi:hypothetical protein U1Q18_033215 [Sarracenia purpurea var. burkii]